MQGKYLRPGFIISEVINRALEQWQITIEQYKSLITQKERIFQNFRLNFLVESYIEGICRENI